MNELYINKLIRLINAKVITLNDIKDVEYKSEVENYFNAQ